MKRRSYPLLLQLFVVVIVALFTPCVASAQTIDELKKMAEQGDASAQFDLACCYEAGNGVAQNAAKAVKWYRNSAEQGNAEAQYNLGLCYYHGEGVDQDYAEAVKWYRKAAEQGGVHPMYLDKVSSAFAVKIEQMSSPSEIRDLIGEMFTSYCRLVKKHSIKKYSPIVQKVIVTIDADLSADLSLASLAKSQNVSAGYLCTLFKKETEKTLIEYIREKRIKHACHLLATTHLQVQTVALNCGIVDVQYFSKTFKKMVGKTPKEFRDHMKK